MNSISDILLQTSDVTITTTVRSTSPTTSISNVHPEEIPSNSSSRRNSLNDDNSLDYALNENGSCTCKLCGEIVSSRTHWYRHKYKVHNVALFRCDKCEVFFKSKKGYEGHLANKHAPKMVGTDGKPKTKKEVEGLNKVFKKCILDYLFKSEGALIRNCK